MNRLRAACTVPVITLVAPAGYGKTTALAQWAERDERPFAWVSVDERDDEPIVLLRKIGAALHGCEPLALPALEALRSPRGSIWTSTVPRLASALASMTSPCVLVLDGAARLRAEESIEVMSILAEHVPEGSTLVLTGRAALPLPVAGLRAQGLLLELGPDLLALSRREAENLLKASGVALTGEQTVSLIEDTEGWPAGLYLAALAIRDGAGRHAPVAGDDRYLGDFFRSEYLSALPPETRAFLRRTSILESMSGPLCDTVLAAEDSAGVLEALDDANVFVVPLDRCRERYRYHRLFRGVLRQELEQHEPELVPLLHRRAADWFEAHGDADATIRHAAQAGDLDRAARVIGEFALAQCDAGRAAAVEDWLGYFAHADLARHPDVALLGAWVHALRGRPTEADRWLAAAEPLAGAPALALVRAALCRDGVERMRADAGTAVAGLPASDRWRPAALLLLGTAQALLDRPDAEETLTRAVRESGAHGATGVGAAALAELALCAGSRDDHDEADRIALEAHALVRQAATEDAPSGTAFCVLTAAVSARAFLRRGLWDGARAELASADSLERMLGRAFPWLAVQTHLELAHAHLTLRDNERARTFAGQAEAQLRRGPDLGGLRGHTDALCRELEVQHKAREGRESGLTSAELRLLPLLATHLSYSEIGGRLSVSRNTIKTQAISIYRRLGVSCRSDAIDRAVEIGLLERAAAVSR